MRNSFSITRKHIHGDVVYCVAMLCNFRRPLVPLHLNKNDADEQGPQPEENREFEENEYEVTDDEADDVSHD